MKDDSLRRIGGICSVLLGLAYLLGGLAYLLQPAELQAAADTTEFWSVLAQDSGMNTLMHWGFGFTGVFGIAVVMVVSELVRSWSEGSVRVTSGLAYVGYAVMVTTHFRSAAVYRAVAEVYVAGDASVQAGIGALGWRLFDLDPQGWLTLGAVGLWILVVNVLALREARWPNMLAYLGIASGLLSWLAVAGSVVEVPVLVAIGAGLGIVVAPSWFIWIGVTLGRPKSLG